MDVTPIPTPFNFPQDISTHRRPCLQMSSGKLLESALISEERAEGEGRGRGEGIALDKEEGERNVGFSMYLALTDQ